jgi:hypothetical protein
MRNLWREELEVIRVIEEAGVGEADRGISIIWWAAACLGGGLLWGLVLLAVGWMA